MWFSENKFLGVELSVMQSASFTELNDTFEKQLKKSLYYFKALSNLTRAKKQNFKEA